MTAATETTFVRPEYRKTSAGHKPVDGVQFFSYRAGIGRFTRISEDGQICATRNHNRSTYGAAVIGHGPICGKTGKPINFATPEAALEAAVKKWRELKAAKP